MHDSTIVISMPIYRQNLSLYIVDKHPREGEADLVRAIRLSLAERVLVFCRKRDEATRVSDLLTQNQITSTTYHSAVADRVGVLKAFSEGARQPACVWYSFTCELSFSAVMFYGHLRMPAGYVRVVCATIAFGLGMDLPNIGLVIHWDVADSLLDYVQQTGRGGRDGSACLCITMYDRVAVQKRHRYARKSKDEKKRDYTLRSMQQVRATLYYTSLPQWLYSSQNPYCSLCLFEYTHNLQVHEWCERTMLCRHVYLQQHFSVTKDDVCEACNSRCDFCRSSGGMLEIVATQNGAQV
jgi:superfamily II DNA/RNA helicase